MANNTVLNVGAGGDTLRDLDRSGVKTPIVAIDLNPAGSETLMAGAMPVTGTFFQATQPVSIASAVPVTGTFWQATQPVSAASLPLPSGASTSAKQAALGTAGTASADVLTVQGIASMTALKVDGSGVTQPVSGTFWQATQPISGTITANAGTNLNTSALALETGGHLAAIDGKVPALGQALAAASVPVVLTAAQLTTLTPLSTIAATQSGTWNVGTLTTLTGITNNVTVVGTGTFVTQSTIQAGTALIGKVSSGLDTSTINNGTTALTPKFAAISTAASGVSTVVAAVTSKKIRVLSYRFQADADVSVKFRDNTAAVDLTGAMAAGAKGGGGGASFSPVGHFETAAGNALSISLSGAVQVSGHLAYVEV